MLKKIYIFTDGSCLGNPGPGGYSTILRYKTYEKILTAGFYFTTNNRMELMSVIAGLESLKKQCSVFITTDSKYVQIGVTSWLKKWKKNQWKTMKKKPVKNIDLWLRLDHSLKNHIIKWFWIKGHVGHIENERCDTIAKKSAEKPFLYDFYYQQNY